MRRWTAYEINELMKYGFDPAALSSNVSDDIPVEYITGYCTFRGIEFVVSPDVLIPRFESEMIIDLASRYFRDEMIFCDVGTGSGCLGISVAKELAKKGYNFKSILSDKSSKALEIAAKNIKRLVENSNIQILESNLLDNYPVNLLGKVDLFLANLPYIPRDRISSLQSSVKDFEPIDALDGGNLGIEIILKFLQQSLSYLAPSGVILLEVDDTHDLNFFQRNVANLVPFSCEVINDENGKNRFWRLLLS